MVMQASKSAENPVSAPDSPAAGTVKVLIVDDCLTNRKLCRGALRDQEFEFSEAEDGHDALRAVQREAPDVILMDVIMPKMDGLECTRRLKAAEATRDIPIIMVSGCTDADEIQAGLEAGADEYLGKPFRVAELRVRVRSMVRQRRNTQVMIRAREMEAATRALQAELRERERIEVELRAAKEAAEDASRTKSGFLATMSHELRTPLNGVIGMTELLLSTALTDQQRKYASIARHSGGTLLCLINDILDISKIEAGRLELECVEFQLQNVLDSVAATLESQAKVKGLELSLACHPQTPQTLEGDPGRLQQVLLNLAGNAIKFTEKGRVSIRTTLEEEREGEVLIRFTVDDTGIGIPADRMDRLFRLFSQVDASTTRKYGGTGLGLAICSRLVDLMRGQIGVVSEPGLGSTFWFTVRLKRANARQSYGTHMIHDLRSLRVLLVADDDVASAVLHEQLSSSGIEACRALTPTEGRAMLREASARGTPFGVAMLGLAGNGDDEDLATEIKADATSRDTVLVRLPNGQPAPDAAELARLGFAWSLDLPVDTNSLVTHLACALACATRDKDLRAGDPIGDVHVAHSCRRTLRVLLADDNPIGREVAMATLARAGHQCVPVEDGLAAVRAVAAERFDVVLMDCQMPGMDGFEATREIRRQEQAAVDAGSPSRRVPIIALTANAIKGDRERCLAAGMDNYATKPFEVDALISMIERYGGGDSLLSEPPELAEAAGRSEAQAPPAGVKDAPAGNPVSDGFDMQRLMKQWGGDQAFVESLLDRFRTQIEAEVRELEHHLEARDLKEATRLAHGIKGAAAYACAEAIRALAARMEESGRAGALDEIVAQVEHLKAEVRRCLASSAVEVCP